MPYGLKDIELQKLCKVFESNERIERVVLYGSRAKGNYKPFSDVDITLIGEKLTHTDLNHLSLVIDDLLLPYQFDISIFHTLKNEALIDHIHRVGITIYERESEWKEFKLGELLQTKGYVRGPFGSALKRGELLDEGIPVYEQQHAIYNKRVFRFFINEAKYEEMRRFTVQTDDIIISCSGTVGEVSIIKENDPKGIISQALLLLRVNPELVLPHYLLFFLKSKNGHNAIVSCSSGSVQINIAKREVIENIPLSLPSIAEQSKIVAVLASLEDKIDLLRRENATLEAMAETLFRQWFVMEAKEDDVALGDVVKTTSGGTPSRKHAEYYENGTICWVKSKELEGSFISSTEELITEDAVSNSSAKMLPEKSVLIAMYGATVGEYGILSRPMTCNQAVCALIPNEKYPFTYLFVWAAMMKQEFINLATGAAQQNISQDLIKQQYVSGDVEKIKEYDSCVRSLFDKMENNQEQINTLIQTRDGLLPRLMSGEIKI